MHMKLMPRGLYVDHMVREMLESAVVSRFRGRLLEYIDRNSQDETAIEVTRNADAVVGVPHAAPVGSAALEAPSHEPVSHDLLTVVHTKLPSVLTQLQRRTPSNIVQSASEYGMLVDIDAENDKFLYVLGSTLNLSQLVERNTG